MEKLSYKQMCIRDRGSVVKLRDKNRASCLPFSAVRAAEKEPSSRARVIIACFRFPANGN